MAGEVRLSLWGIVLDAPDPQQLAGFYQRLLGWEVAQDEPGWVKLRAPEGGPGLSFQQEDNYVRPVWPATPGNQQMSIHLDVRVTDLEAAQAHAVDAGAIVADFQPQSSVRVLFDPDGHPFCLFEH